MALVGTHIVCGYVGGRTGPALRVALSSKAAWSETMAAPGTTAKAAPTATASLGDPSFSISPTADIWVAIGPAPDATTGTRYFVPLSEGTRNIFCEEGDKLAWIAA